MLWTKRQGVRSTRRGRPSWALVFGVVSAIVVSSRIVFAATCPASAYEPANPDRTAALGEAQQFSFGKRYADARAIYLWLLARDGNDIQALAGLARIDAWEGCWALAERWYRQVLAQDPADSEVRGGLVDLLTWQRRWADAELVLHGGPADASGSVPILLRRSRISHWDGNDEQARELLRQAEAMDPKDQDVKDLANEIYLGRGALGVRLDFFPARYPNIQTYDSTFMQRWRRFDFELHSRLVEWEGGGLEKPLVDEDDSLTLTFHPMKGFSASLGAGIGHPGVLLPEGEFMAGATFPIWQRLTGAVEYSYWAFAGAVGVHIVNPTLGYEATDTLELAAHAWLVWVDASGPLPLHGFATTVGAHVGWKVLKPLKFLLYYTYGAQLDHDPTAAQLLSLRSHTVTLSADWSITREYGLLGLLAEELRNSSGAPTIPIESVGTTFYVRW